MTKDFVLTHAGRHADLMRQGCMKRLPEPKKKETRPTAGAYKARLRKAWAVKDAAYNAMYEGQCHHTVMSEVMRKHPNQALVKAFNDAWSAYAEIEREAIADRRAYREGSSLYFYTRGKNSYPEHFRPWAVD